MENAAPKCGSSDKRNAEYLQAYTPEKYFRYLIQKESPVIFDIGAHKGESVRFFKEIFPESRIYSFEPDPDNFIELEKCCAETNTFYGEKVFAINKAVGEISGVASFYRQSISHLGGLLPINKSSKDSLGYAEKAINESFSVETITVDQFSAEVNLDHIDILKIDVQGFEVGVLRGAMEMLQKTSCCTVEVSFYDFYEQKSSLLLIEQEIQAAEMMLWDISKVSKNPKNFRTDWAELVSVRNNFAKD